MYIDEFVEDLSNCIGFISGDELILKKMRYDFEYEIRTRNRDKKLGFIKWDTDNNCIVILLNNKSYSFDRSELTIEKTKEIGKMINKAYYNMNLDEAKQVLKENGYILEVKNDIIGNLVDLEVLNNRLQRLDKGWHFDVSRCNSTAKVFVIEKEGVGYFRFSVLLSMVRNEAGNDTLLSRARLLGYEKEEGSQKNMDNICAMLFKEED